MHLNPRHPNILNDMQVAAISCDLHNRDRFGVVSAKRHMAKGLEDMFGPRRYPYASERQTHRQQARISNAYTEIVDMYKSHPEYAELGIFAGYGKAETQG